LETLLRADKEAVEKRKTGSHCMVGDTEKMSTFRHGFLRFEDWEKRQ